MRRPRLASALLFLPVALAGCLEAPEVDAFTAPVIGGAPTPEGKFPAVGALLEDGELFCSGTLIRPDVVLTAAHCLMEPTDPARIGFALARDVVSAPVAQVRARTWVVHEGLHLPEPLPVVPDRVNDIALVFLQQSIPGVPPATLPTPAEVATLVPGAAIEIVGYGAVDVAGDDSGVKFDATTDLVAIGAHELQLSSTGRPQNCYGDSGGPAFATIGGGTRVVGVVSRTASLTDECAFGGLDTRVDAYRAWIALHLDRLAPPPASVPDAGVPAAPDAGVAPPVRDRDGGGGCTIGGAGAGARTAVARLVLAVLASVALLAGRRGVGRAHRHDGSARRRSASDTHVRRAEAACAHRGSDPRRSAQARSPGPHAGPSRPAGARQDRGPTARRSARPQARQDRGPTPAGRGAAGEARRHAVTPRLEPLSSDDGWQEPG